MAEDDKAADAPFEPKVTLPDAVKDYLLGAYKNASSILEYGSGGSTVLAARETKAEVISIESDKAWADNLMAFLKLKNLDRDNVQVVHEDIGATKDWGYPVNFRQWNKYYNYPTGIWQRKPDYKPDVVLVDGRFRKACFAAVMLHCKQPTKLIFDDYLERKSYHEVENFFEVKEQIERAAVFEIEPRPYSNDEFQVLLAWFFQLQ